MAEEVSRSLSVGEHLLVQAGTGTGKSLAYLVPSLLHGRRVVVATATLALQHQLVERDLPALVEAAGDRLPKGASYAVLKGRSNYACLHRVREGVPDDQGTLVDVPADGSLGSEVLALREWVEEQARTQGTGERDIAPRHTERVWSQVSVSARECLGATRCAFAEECFAERAKERAGQSRVVVTNHSLLAIDAIEGVPMIPEYDAVVVDEAHELVARVTQASTDDLSPTEVDRVARRSRKHVEAREGALDNPADLLADAGEELAAVLESTGAGRIDRPGHDLLDALAGVRDAARGLVSAFPREREGEVDATRQQAKAWAQELFDHAERMAAFSDADVLWVSDRDRSRGGPQLHVAPLQVWRQMRNQLMREKTVVMTSATLMLGGDFATLARSVGLVPDEQVTQLPDDSRTEQPELVVTHRRDSEEIDPSEPVPWRGVDVGSPFDYPRQGILYVARHLPPPGRDGLGPAQLDEIVDLVDTAEGRTLGLFSSRRAAEAAAEVVRERLPHLTTLVQGEAQLPELRAQFMADPHTSLFGTLSLWQGFDAPGETCSLVIIDRIPFPRPDDPLMSARAKAADEAGGNGFMSVSATHAALLLAQGAGRLVRSTEDRGMVAILDPRVVTKRYGAFLAASLPPLWRTTDPAVARGALTRLTGG
ncbi:ATP-dependent DNA helicase [Nocardioidaceae bacterium]|nr:ATP-dependent DNA helicase [Nocardioidaceae bacterium]